MIVVGVPKISFPKLVRVSSKSTCMNLLRRYINLAKAQAKSFIIQSCTEQHSHVQFCLPDSSTLQLFPSILSFYKLFYMAVPKLAMLMFCLCMLAMAGGAWCRESVTITNRLTEPLRVQCHSHDDLFAEHTLAPAQVYVFHFHKNIFGNTLYTCDFRAASYGYAGVKVWEGFHNANRKVSCMQCRWDVTPYGFNCNGQYEPYSWSK